VDSPQECSDAWPAWLVDDLPVALGQVDARGYLIRGNAALAAFLHLDPRELAGFDLHQVPWPTVGADGGTTIMDRLLDGDLVDGIFPMSRGPGPATELRIRGVPTTRHGEPAGGTVTISEVPAGLVSQHSVGRDAEAYRLLADHLADIILVTEADLMTWVSPSMRRILGHDPRSLVGSRVADLVHPDDHRPAEVTPATPTVSVRHRLRHADGSYRWFDTNVTGRFGPDGALIARYGSARDIDDRVQLEGQVFAGERRFREAWTPAPTASRSTGSNVTTRALSPRYAWSRSTLRARPGSRVTQRP
jgi:PAS domain S-box-containing protein